MEQGKISKTVGRIALIAGLILAAVILAACASTDPTQDADSGFEAVDASNNDQVAVRGGDDEDGYKKQLRPHAANGRAPREVSETGYYLTLETISRIEGAIQSNQREALIDVKGFDLDCGLQIEHVLAYRSNGASVEVIFAPPGDDPYVPAEGGEEPVSDPVNDNPLNKEPCNPPNLSYDKSGGYTDPGPDHYQSDLVQCPEVKVDGNVTQVQCSTLPADYDPSKDPTTVYNVEKQFDLTLINCPDPLKDTCDFILSPSVPDLPFDPAADPTSEEYVLATFDCADHPDFCKIQVDILTGGPYEPSVAEEGDDSGGDSATPTPGASDDDGTLQDCDNRQTDDSCVTEDGDYYYHESAPDPDGDPFELEAEAIEETEKHIYNTTGEKQSCTPQNQGSEGYEERGALGKVYVTVLSCE